MKTSLLFSFIALIAYSSCIPDKIKTEMNDGMRMSMEMMADENFKKAVGHLEVHKLRFGVYPNTLNDLKFLPVMDSSLYQAVQYSKLEKGYELNLVMRYFSFVEKSDEIIHLDYPDEFWKGLGCVKSNLKK